MGWARAQLVYDKLDKPPPFGSLLELMCLVIQRERAQLALLGARAQAQAALGGESAETAFKEYASAYSRVETEDTTRKMREQIEELKKIKEIHMRPLVPTTRQLKLPVVSAQDMRDRGLLKEQMRPAESTRPVRARTQRKAR